MEGTYLHKKEHTHERAYVHPVGYTHGRTYIRRDTQTEGHTEGHGNRDDIDMRNKHTD